MLSEISALNDVTDAVQQVLSVTRSMPPHVRPWLRGVEAEAEHIKVEVATVSRRAANGFRSWLDSGLSESEEA